MKVYSKIVLGPDFDVLEEISTEYTGPVAEAKGSSVKYPKPSYSAAGQIIMGDLRQPLTGALKDSIINNPFTDASSREYQLAQDSIRGSYGARGLANSGIAIQGEQQALSDIALKSQAQRANQLTGILGTGSSSPSFPGGTPQQGSGFLGLK